MTRGCRARNIASIAGALCAGAIVVATASALQPSQGIDSLSITPVRTFSTDSGIAVAAGRFTMENMPISVLVGFAYEGEEDEMRGLPVWAMRERYNVSAVIDANLERTDIVKQIRNVVTARFGLRAHIETEPREVLALMRMLPDRPLIGLRQIDVDCAAPGRRGGTTRGSGSRDDVVVPPCATHSGRTIVSGGESMAQFAGFLSALVGTKVVDRTGLDGYYAYSLKFAPDLPGAEAPTPEYPSLRSALRQQLGLMLVRRTVPWRVLVIDRIEQPSKK